MKKIKLFLAAMAAMVSLGVNAITIDTDLTSQFSSLTQKESWTGAGGYTATNFCPMVTVGGGIGQKQVCERYDSNCDRTGDIFYATVKGLSAGTYRIELYGGAAYTFGRGFSSTAFSEGTWNAGDKIEPSETVSTGVTLYAQSEDVTYGGEIPIYYATNFPDGAATVTIDGVVVGASGQIKIGMSKTSTSTNWHVIQLKSVTATVDADAALAVAVNAAKAVDQSQLPESVASALATAIENNNKTYETADEYLTAIDALNTATSNANIYIVAGPALDAMKTLVDATNFYTTEAYNEYYGQWKGKFDAGTLTLAEANSLQNPNTVTGWHAALTVDNFLLSVWDVEPDFAGAYYINSWSNEGSSDGSNFKVPFFEYWTGDGNSLDARVLTATIENLEATSVYSVEIWARVRQRNDGTKTAESITMQVGEGNAVDLTAGSQIGTSQFYIDHFTAVGKTDADGKLVVKINVAENSNISWLSFKNVKYAKVELTDFENALADAISAAEAIKDEPMNAAVASALSEAISNYKNVSYDNADDYQTAIDAVMAATETANASIAVYQEIAAYNTAAAALQGDAAVAAYAETLTAYNDGTLTESAPARAALIEATKVAEPVSDITILAPTSWVGQSGTAAAWAVGDTYAGIPERYQGGAFTGDVMTQTITGLQKGTYTVTLHGAASYTSGRGFDGATGQNHAYFFANDALQSLEVYDRTSVDPTTMETAVLVAGVGEDGVLKYGIQNITTGANWFVLDVDKIEYTSATLPETEVTLSVTAAKWATFIAPFDADIPAGVTVYTVDDYEKSGKHRGLLTMTAVDKISANTPVLLYAEAPVTKELSGVSTAEGMNYTVGLLTGVYGDLEITEGYVLQNQETNGIGFYAVSAENAKTVPAYHAYLTVPAEENVKFFGFGDTATRINGVLNALQAGETYDLSGRRVSKLQKGGVYIVNGVKVAVK